MKGIAPRAQITDASVALLNDAPSDGTSASRSRQRRPSTRLADAQRRRDARDCEGGGAIAPLVALAAACAATARRRPLLSSRFALAGEVGSRDLSRTDANGGRALVTLPRHADRR